MTRNSGVEKRQFPKIRSYIQTNLIYNTWALTLCVALTKTRYDSCGRRLFGSWRCSTFAIALSSDRARSPGQHLNLAWRDACDGRGQRSRCHCVWDCNCHPNPIQSQSRPRHRSRVVESVMAISTECVNSVLVLVGCIYCSYIFITNFRTNQVRTSGNLQATFLKPEDVPYSYENSQRYIWITYTTN